MRIAVLTVAIVLGTQSLAHATCGERGGPGYRAPDGHCVGWAEIGKVCGSPPATRCTAEEVRTGAEAAAKLGTEIQKLRPPSAPTGQP
jgi:hypothetical protein